MAADVKHALKHEVDVSKSLLPQSCQLVIIDPAEFERRAHAAVREDVRIDTGKSF